MPCSPYAIPSERSALSVRENLTKRGQNEQKRNATVRKRAFGYVRVSDESQIDGHSLSEQEFQIRSYCEARGLVLARIFRDEGISGRYDEVAKRPGFKAMLAAVSRHEADLVVVHTLDRWARNVLVTLVAFKNSGGCPLCLCVTE